MSRHFNTVLGHFKMGPLKKKVENQTNDDNGSVASGSVITEDVVDATANNLMSPKKQQQQQQKNIQQQKIIISEIKTTPNGTISSNGGGTMMVNKRNSLTTTIHNNQSIGNSVNSVNSGGGGGSGFSALNKIQQQSTSASVQSGIITPTATLSPRMGQRKLSQDMRLKGINLDEHNNESLTSGVMCPIKPVKLKTITTKAEAYDTLHIKSMHQVSFI